MEKKSFTFDEIKMKLVNYCVYQDRCHAEVEQKMREFLLIDEAKEEILLYLMKENYLNEERFTRSHIRGKFYIKHWGKTKIKIHLKQKQVSDKLINLCFDEIDEDGKPPDDGVTQVVLVPSVDRTLLVFPAWDGSKEFKVLVVEVCPVPPIETGRGD